MPFRDCLDAALKEGLISQEDHERLVSRHEALSRDDPLNARARLADEETIRAADARRNKLLQVKAQDSLWRNIVSAVRLNAERNMGQDLPALLNGVFENITQNGMLSVRGVQSQLLGSASYELSSLLQTFRRSAATRRRFNRPMLDDVARAAFGENVSEEAKALYGAFRTVSEKLREMYNALGGHIGWREDWGLPQWHNPGALINSGFDQWRDYIIARLDWDKMKSVFGGDLPIGANDRSEILWTIFQSITQDGWNGRSLEGTVKGAKSFANKRADHRFLVFKSADDWLDYSRQYGAGEPFEVMMRHIRSMTRDIGLMQILGPNPGATVEWMKALLTKEAKAFNAGAPSLFGDGGGLLGGWRRGHAESAAQQAARTLDGFFEVAKGQIAPRSPVGDVVQIYGNNAYAAMLGSTVLTDIAVNPVVQTMMRRLNGLPMMRGAFDTLRSMSREEALAAESILGDMLHTLERGAREDASLHRLAEFSNWLPEVTTHYSGMNGLSQAMRNSAMMAQQAQAAANRALAWGALDPRYRDMLKGFAINEADWDVIRAATPDERRPGDLYLRPRDVARLGPDAEDAARKYGAMLHQMIEIMQPQSSWRAQAWVRAHGAQDPATLMGFMVKSASMFKAGWLPAAMITQWSQLRRELARSKSSLAGHAAVYVPLMMAAGVVSVQLRQLATGKDLLPMDPADEKGRATWAKGMLASGGMILLGDFIKAETSSYGHGFGATLAGPLFQAGTTAADTVGAPVKLAYDWAFGNPQTWNPGGDLVKALRGNTPLLSTHWALRAAYNRVILDQLQYMADPHAHESFRRTQSKVLRDTGQGFWWRPGAVAPERVPALN